MKRFSDMLVDDREFEVGGEIFKWRYPFWEEMAAIFDEDVDLLKNLDADSGQMPSTKESIERTIERSLVFIDPEDGAHERFRALAQRKDPPVPLFLFGEIYRWLLEVTSNRPSRQPSASEPGAGNSEASSAGRSRSQAVTRIG